MDEDGESFICASTGQMNLAAQGYHRVLKLARTIADLAGCEQIQAAHLEEALQKRLKMMHKTVRWGKETYLHMGVLFFI